MDAANSQHGIVVACEATRIGIPGHDPWQKKLEKAAYMLLQGRFFNAHEIQFRPGRLAIKRGSPSNASLQGRPQKVTLSLERLLNAYEWDPP